MKLDWYVWVIIAALIVLALYYNVDLAALGRALLWVKEFSQ